VAPISFLTDVPQQLQQASIESSGSTTPQASQTPVALAPITRPLPSSKPLMAKGKSESFSQKFAAKKSSIQVLDLSTISAVQNQRKNARDKAKAAEEQRRKEREDEKKAKEEQKRQEREDKMLQKEMERDAKRKKMQEFESDSSFPVGLPVSLPTQVDVADENLPQQEPQFRPDLHSGAAFVMEQMLRNQQMHDPLRVPAPMDHHPQFHHQGAAHFGFPASSFGFPPTVLPPESAFGAFTPLMPTGSVAQEQPHSTSQFSIDTSKLTPQVLSIIHGSNLITPEKIALIQNFTSGHIRKETSLSVF
jgi:hypothetical protein